MSDEKNSVVLGSECQALVLVFDVESESSFDNVRRYALFIAQYNPAVLLIVANELKEVTHPLVTSDYDEVIVIT